MLIRFRIIVLKTMYRMHKCRYWCPRKVGVSG